MNIIQDTREQIPFSFNYYTDIKITKQALKTGDYILSDYPKGIVIERKMTLSEIQLNTKEIRFIKEMERMQEFEEAYILCSFPFSRYIEFPRRSGIPQKKWKFLREGGMDILRRVRQIEADYMIPFLYFDTQAKAEEEAVNLFTEYIKKKTQ